MSRKHQRTHPHLFPIEESLTLVSPIKTREMIVDETIEKHERKFHSLEMEIKTIKKSFQNMAKSNTKRKSQIRSTQKDKDMYCHEIAKLVARQNQKIIKRNQIFVTKKFNKIMKTMNIYRQDTDKRLNKMDARLRVVQSTIKTIKKSISLTKNKSQKKQTNTFHTPNKNKMGSPNKNTIFERREKDMRRKREN